jgi:hypothetical protein
MAPHTGFPGLDSTWLFPLGLHSKAAHAGLPGGREPCEVGWCTPAARERGGW